MRSIDRTCVTESAGPMPCPAVGPDPYWKHSGISRIHSTAWSTFTCVSPGSNRSITARTAASEQSEPSTASNTRMMTLLAAQILGDGGRLHPRVPNAIGNSNSAHAGRGGACLQATLDFVQVIIDSGKRVTEDE